MMWTLTIRLNTGGWILHDIQEQVLEAAAQIPWRCLVGIPDCLQLLDGHQLICLRWQACTASHAAKSMQDCAAARWLCPGQMSCCSRENAGAFIRSDCLPSGWECVGWSSASACSRGAYLRSCPAPSASAPAAAAAPPRRTGRPQRRPARLATAHQKRRVSPQMQACCFLQQCTPPSL